MKSASAEDSHATVTGLLCPESPGIPGVAGGWGSIELEDYSLNDIEQVAVPEGAPDGE
ncbi:hypothetical protein [Microbacterium maritypicum]